MTLMISGRIIQKYTELSELARQTMPYIDGGPEWLGWAMSSSGARYELPDETTLVAAVQQGLHACPMTLLPGLGLWVSPIKLMSLGVANLRVVAQAETGDTSEVTNQQMQRILAEHRLVTAQTLHGVTAFLHELGVASAALFQAADFNDKLALHDLAGSSSGQQAAWPADLRAQAAAWALKQARTTAEFCDYYQVYLACASSMHSAAATADACAAQAGRALETILPLAFARIDCPQLRGACRRRKKCNDACKTGWRRERCRVSRACRTLCCKS